jgi:hypothetical protein
LYFKDSDFLVPNFWHFTWTANLWERFELQKKLFQQFFLILKQS